MELSSNGEAVDKKPVLTADGFIQTTNPTKNPAINSPNNTLTATNLDIDILPVIYDIIRWYVLKRNENKCLLFETFLFNVYCTIKLALGYMKIFRINHSVAIIYCK